MNLASHANIDPAEAIRSVVDIACVGVVLGCRVRSNRMTAAWRGGDGLSVSLDRQRGLFYDHRDGKGGDVIKLVMLCRGCGFGEALAWLADFYGVELKQPDTETLRRSQRRRQQAQVTAEGLADLRWRVTQYLRAVRNSIWSECSRFERESVGPHRIQDRPAGEWKRMRERMKLADGIDDYITHLTSLPAAELIKLRDRLEGAIAA